MCLPPKVGLLNLGRCPNNARHSKCTAVVCKLYFLSLTLWSKEKSSAVSERLNQTKVGLLWWKRVRGPEPFSSPSLLFPGILEDLQAPQDTNQKALVKLKECGLQSFWFFSALENTSIDLPEL